LFIRDIAGIWIPFHNARLPNVGFSHTFLDNTDQTHKLWKISMQQWHETTRSSVGDSLLLSGWSAQATDLTTKDVVAGRVQTVEGLSETFMRHLSELAEAEESKTQSPSSQPVAR
jgi:hypothetical protein